MFEFRLKFHWCLFLRVQLTIFHHWFRYWLGAVQATSHYLNQWWLDYRRIYASLGLNEVISVRQYIYHYVSILSDDGATISTASVLKWRSHGGAVPLWCLVPCNNHLPLIWWSILASFIFWIRNVVFSVPVDCWHEKAINYKMVRTMFSWPANCLGLNVFIFRDLQCNVRWLEQFAMLLKHTYDLSKIAVCHLENRLLCRKFDIFTWENVLEKNYGKLKTCL